mmetsp:Transcript_52397/g.59517  ORF Transcript_52397/g.59517 Transcript_52397/m.59517 type:complete len:96 (-) Transcript_52397:349-636(-)
MRRPSTSTVIPLSNNPIRTKETAPFPVVPKRHPGPKCNFTRGLVYKTTTGRAMPFPIPYITSVRWEWAWTPPVFTDISRALCDPAPTAKASITRS